MIGFKIKATKYTNEIVFQANLKGFCFMVFAEKTIDALVFSKQLGLTLHHVNKG